MTMPSPSDPADQPAAASRALIRTAARLGAIALLLGVSLSCRSASAQPAPAEPAAIANAITTDEAQALADADLASPNAEASAGLVDASAPVLELFIKGGWLMAPIVLMSILVAAIAVERMMGLRRSRVAPRSLMRGLRQLAEVGDFEPRAAYRICEAHPSAASRVFTALLGKTGRPHTEVESAAAEATQREADHMYANVRTLNLAAAVTPLMGLLGTVWGMIAAFFVTASMPLGSNKGQALAEGIYLALVTTFAGLAVAIPAAVLAHYFEGRILHAVRKIESLVAELLPRMERFEGGVRLDQTALASEGLVDVPGQGDALPEWTPAGGSRHDASHHGLDGGPEGGAGAPHDAFGSGAPTETWGG